MKAEQAPTNRGRVEPLYKNRVLYLTTTGRRSGLPHTIEIWFVGEGDTVYLVSGGGFRSDWVKNLQKDARVTLKIARRSLHGLAKVLEGAGEVKKAKDLWLAKYYGDRWAPSDAEGWAKAAVPVAITLEAEAATA